MGCLRDGSSDVGSVSVVVVGVAIIAHKVPRLYEGDAFEVLGHVELSVIFVGDAGVENSDDNAFAVSELPSGRHVDLPHVPLEFVLWIIWEACPVGAWSTFMAAYACDVVKCGGHHERE